MDDLTITTEPASAAAVFDAAKRALAKWGLHVNEDKSAIISKSAELPICGIRRGDVDEQFIILGANITQAYTTFNSETTTKFNRFFDKLDESDIHPQLKWTILRMCGAPKLIYYASTTPPQFSQSTLQQFDSRMIQSAERIAAPGIDRSILHHIHGGGIPQYAANGQTLYQASKLMSVDGVHADKVPLISHSDHSDPVVQAHLDANYHQLFLFYARESYYTFISPCEFRMALCTRLMTLPREVIDFPWRCRCGELCTHSKSCSYSSIVITFNAADLL
jgi:hypothetical protein